MWLPRRIYESLPWTYIVLGLLYIAGVIYIGLFGSDTAFYLSLGLLLVFCGLLVHRVRYRARHRAEGEASDDARVG